MMDFYEVLDQVIGLLQRHGRVTYRALQCQFDLDQGYLEDLKDAILFTYPVADEDSRGLVWTGETGSPEPDARRRTEDERHFQLLLSAVISLLQRDRRVTYRTLKYVFSIDDALIEEIREELRLRQLAVDEEGKVLAWIGETQPVTLSVVDFPSQPITVETTVIPSPAVSTSPFVTETPLTSNGPTTPEEAISTEVPQDEPLIPSEPTRTAPEAERRQLTVMFCDLADSTKLSQELDPEDLREVIRAYQQTSADVIQRYDGYIAQHLGDGLLIYFGWPRAHEDDAQRAMHAGLGIVEAITTNLNPRLKAEKGVQLTVRLGVHTGPVVVGEMGGGDRLESLATGETVNIAARLEGLAQPNTVVISQVTERLVRDAFTLADLGPQMLKGVSEPMRLFRVLSPTADHRDEDESLPDGGVFLVGRDEEIGLLLRRWEQSKEGLGQVVLISGEAGIGKSSLVATLRQRVMEEGYTRITFRCSPYHTNSALYPVITHLEQMLNFERDDSPDAKLDKLEQVLRTTSLSLEESVPLLATLLSIALEGRYSTPTLSPQQQRQQMLDTLVGWMMEEAERQPVLAVWENLHWSDPSTLEMLGLVLEQTPTVPMLHLLTFRPEFSPPWPTRSHMTPITLNRLERPQVEALLTHLSGGKALPTEVIEHIVTKTDGVPLYVEELTKMLMASDLLEEQVDQYVLTGPLSTMAIPDTLQDSLMARLDQMNTAKEIAQLGAVLGREFAYEMIQAVSSQDEETLQAGLTQLVEAELLYQRGRPPRARYIFKHALIQDAAYASLLRSQRRQMHQRVAQVLAEQFPETVETQPELLAHHCTEAGLHEKAIEYWRQAGERALQRSANIEAVAYLKNGLALLENLPDSSRSMQYELGLLTKLGPALMASKGYTAPEVEETYDRAHMLCQQIGETPQLFPVLFGLWIYYGTRAELQKARDLAEHLLQLARRFQDPDLLLQAHHALWMTLYNYGDVVSVRAHCEEGLSLYDPPQHHAHTYSYGGHDPGVCCRGFLARTLWFLGYPEQAFQKSCDALSLASEVSHPLSLVQAMGWATWVHLLRRDVHEIQARAEAVIALSAEHGFPYWQSQGMILHGWVLTVHGQSDAGLQQMRQGLDELRVTRSEMLLSWYLSILAEAQGQSGNVAEGLCTLTEALALVEQTEGRLWEAELHCLRGKLLLQQSSDNQPEAEACFQQAITIAQNQSAKSWELRASTSLAKLWQPQGKRKEAYDLLAPVYGWFTEGFDTADLIDAKALLDELAYQKKKYSTTFGARPFRI